jgi:hypothetical protein
MLVLAVIANLQGEQQGWQPKTGILLSLEFFLTDRSFIH